VSKKILDTGVLNKDEIALMVSVETSLNKDTCIQVIDSFLNTVYKSIKSGKRVKLRGFGSYILDSKIRKGVTLETVQFIPSCTIAKEFS
jgi:nucleoid DNA-binding protein